MEAHANSTDDYLVDGLSYQLKPGASYVQRREFATWFPQGSDTYSSTSGVKVIKIRLSGDTWMRRVRRRQIFELGFLFVSTCPPQVQMLANPD